MRSTSSPARRPLALALTLMAAPAACAGDDGGRGDGSASASTSAGTASATATSGSASASSSSGTSDGSDSASSGATEGSTSAPSSDSATGDAASGGTTSGGETSGTTALTGEGSSSTGPECVPAEEICNDLDDDCDGIVDNVDVGGDGICDCLNIAILGNPGSNPSAEFQAWLEAQGTSVDRIHTSPNEVLDPATLAKYDIVILDWLVRAYTPEEASTTRAWIEGGGGLMSMTGHVADQSGADRPNSLIGPMGLSYNTSAGFFSGPITTFAPHPITAGLTSISFYGGLFIDVADDGVGQNSAIMTLPPGPVGVVQDREAGAMFIFGDEWVEFDSEWQNMPEIKLFWVQVLGYIVPESFCTIPQ